MKRLTWHRKKSCKRYQKAIEWYILVLKKEQKLGADDKWVIKTKANASIDIRKENLDSSFGNNIDFTKTIAAAGIEKELSSKASGGIGLKAMKLKNEDQLSPYFNFSYKPDSIWKFSLGYEEDLGNDNLEKIFLPYNRYVDTQNLDFKASKKKTFKTSVDYRTHNGDCIGVDLFSQKEDNSMVPWIHCHPLFQFSLFYRL